MLTGASLQIRGATAGGEVAYLGANLVEHHESWASLDTYSGVLTDGEASGEVEFAPKGGISPASVWVVVDLASGEVVTVTPASFAKQLPEAMDIEVSPGRDALSVDRADLELLLYRPGVGVWFGKAIDHDGPDESVGGEANVGVDLGAFRLLRPGDPPAPIKLSTGDRLFAIDLHHLDAASVTFQ